MSAARKYPAVKKPEPYRPRHAEPGFDGKPTALRKVRDLDDRTGARDLVVEERPDVLEWLRTHGNGSKDPITGEKHRHIQEYQLQAGRKLEELWTTGILAPSASSGAGGSSGNSSTLPADAKLDAMQKYGKAMAAVRAATNYDCASTMFYVVCFNKTIAEVAKIAETRRINIMPQLDAALDALAKHFHLA